MDSTVKRELIASGVQAIVLPLARAATDSHYRMKQIERQEEMELKIAERRARGARAMANPGGGAQAAAVEPVHLESPGDVYDELQALRQQTDCSFCQGMVDQLMEADPNEAKRGFEELRTYDREVERIDNADITESEAKQIVSELVDGWEVIPKYAAGAGV